MSVSEALIRQICVMKAANGLISALCVCLCLPASPTHPWCSQNQTHNEWEVSREWAGKHCSLLEPECPVLTHCHLQCSLSSNACISVLCLAPPHGSHLCPLGLSHLLCPLPSHMAFSPLTRSCAGHSCFLIPWWVSCCLLLSHCAWSTLMWYS